MANKYLEVGTSGLPTEREATVVSAGSGDAGKIVALASNGRLDQSVLPTGIGQPTYTGNAAENLAAGDLVYVTATGTVAKADASASNASKTAVGFVLTAVTNGNPATVYLEGINDSLSGLTVGSRYFLSGTTAGGITATAPSTAGHVVQLVGVAVSANSLVFRPEIIAIRS
jgi:hypothetical protein